METKKDAEFDGCQDMDKEGDKEVGGEEFGEVSRADLVFCKGFAGFLALILTGSRRAVTVLSKLRLLSLFELPSCEVSCSLG